MTSCVRDLNQGPVFAIALAFSDLRTFHRLYSHVYHQGEEDDCHHDRADHCCDSLVVMGLMMPWYAYNR